MNCYMSGEVIERGIKVTKTRKYSKIEITLVYDGRSKLIRNSKTAGIMEMMDIIDRFSDNFPPGFILKGTLMGLEKYMEKHNVDGTRSEEMHRGTIDDLLKDLHSEDVK